MPFLRPVLLPFMSRDYHQETEAFDISRKCTRPFRRRVFWQNIARAIPYFYVEPRWCRIIELSARTCPAIAFENTAIRALFADTVRAWWKELPGELDVIDRSNRIMAGLKQQLAVGRMIFRISFKAQLSIKRLLDGGRRLIYQSCEKLPLLFRIS